MEMETICCPWEEPGEELLVKDMMLTVSLWKNMVKLGVFRVSGILSGYIFTIQLICNTVNYESFYLIQGIVTTGLDGSGWGDHDKGVWIGGKTYGGSC